MSDRPPPHRSETESADPTHRADCRHARHRRRRGGPKERVLHTRISQQLSEDIREIADDLRVPVSNLVRNVLEEAFSVVETVTGNVGDLIEEVVEEAEAGRARIRRRRRHRQQPHGRGHREETPGESQPARAPRADFPDVLGWQPLVLNRPQPCADCEEPLARGDRAFAGATASGFSSHTLCADCMDARRA